MGWACAAPGCRTGLRARKGKNVFDIDPPASQVTLHRIPQNPKRRAAWMKAIPRDN